ncbi:hypothetical protein B0T19DRAFT_462203 [Cercophora scortea]|uniref:Uncharacterized protein n=1 Tax=Cercophora scortea TaxID=314031 RepID=A0AAE0IP58_9PEZI|nr:hypothetical protein B0T19DRAFT_462203 [Cercophora scortea]
MACNQTQLDCSVFSDMSGFQQYMELIRNETDFNATLLGFCRNEICGVLWGIGNPDVSGIGICTCSLCRLDDRRLFKHHTIDNEAFKKAKVWVKRPLERGFESFFTSAIYFTMSLLVAINYSLARRDFDISAEGFGIIQAKITSTISVLCVLPLLYPLVMGLPDERSLNDRDHLEVSCTKYKQQFGNGFSRSLLSVLVMALFLLQFIFQCNLNWAPSVIGKNNGPGGTTVVSLAEWDTVTGTCLGEYTPMGDVEGAIISVFEMLGSIVYMLATVCSFGRLPQFISQPEAHLLFDIMRCIFDL